MNCAVDFCSLFILFLISSYSQKLCGYNNKVTTSFMMLKKIGGGMLTERNRWGHDVRLHHCRFRMPRRKAYFSVKFPNNRNKLPLEVITAIDVFVRLLDSIDFPISRTPFSPFAFLRFSSFIRARHFRLSFCEYSSRKTQPLNSWNAFNLEHRLRISSASFWF